MKNAIRKILIGLAVIVVLVMALSFSACSDNRDSAETKSLYAQGLEVVRLMSEMTRMEEYVGLHTGNEEIKAVVRNISAGDYSEPKEVYAISVTDDSLEAMANLGDLEGASEELKTVLAQRVFASLMPQINGMSGVDNLAAASICTVGKTFVNENIAKDVICLYTYENAVPVAVTFTVGEEQTVSASGMFVMYDGFPCGSADEIKDFFGYIPVAVTEIQPEK